MLALYRRPRAEQLRRLALRMGAWRDDEMRATTTGSGPPGFQYETADAQARAALFQQVNE